jgi:hypothetical protein
VKGRKTEFMIYELLALRNSEDPKRRERFEDVASMMAMIEAGAPRAN